MLARRFRPETWKLDFVGYVRAHDFTEALSVLLEALAACSQVGTSKPFWELSEFKKELGILLRSFFQYSFHVVIELLGVGQSPGSSTNQKANGRRSRIPYQDQETISTCYVILLEALSEVGKSQNISVPDDLQEAGAIQELKNKLNPIVWAKVIQIYDLEKKISVDEYKSYCRNHLYDGKAKSVSEFICELKLFDIVPRDEVIFGLVNQKQFDDAFVYAQEVTKWVQKQEQHDLAKTSDPKSDIPIKSKNIMPTLIRLVDSQGGRSDLAVKYIRKCGLSLGDFPMVTMHAKMKAICTVIRLGKTEEFAEDLCNKDVKLQRMLLRQLHKQKEYALFAQYAKRYRAILTTNLATLLDHILDNTHEYMIKEDRRTGKFKNTRIAFARVDMLSFKLPFKAISMVRNSHDLLTAKKVLLGGQTKIVGLGAQYYPAFLADRDEICLLQVACKKKIFLFDLLLFSPAMGTLLSELFKSQNVLKCGYHFHKHLVEFRRLVAKQKYNDKKDYHINHYLDFTRVEETYADVIPTSAPLQAPLPPAATLPSASGLPLIRRRSLPLPSRSSLSSSGQRTINQRIRQRSDPSSQSRSRGPGSLPGARNSRSGSLPGPRNSRSGSLPGMYPGPPSLVRGVSSPQRGYQGRTPHTRRRSSASQQSSYLPPYTSQPSHSRPSLAPLALPQTPTSRSTLFAPFSSSPKKRLPSPAKSTSTVCLACGKSFKSVSDRRIHQREAKHRHGIPSSRQKPTSSNWTPLGLTNLCKSCLGKGMNTDMKVSNWKRRPLNKRQLKYAALNAHVLVELYEYWDYRFPASDMNPIYPALYELCNNLK